MSSVLIISSGFAVGIAAGTAMSVLINHFKPVKESSEQTSTSFLFSGNLKQTSIVDAIQFLEIGKREGILHIYSGRRKGYITFSQGRVIDAFYRNMTGREATFAMLDLGEGDFYFESKIINQPRLISESIMDLVMEWDSHRNRQ